MKWSTLRELLKTFGILTLDILGFFAILTLLVTAAVAFIVGVIAILCFWLSLFF